MIAVIGAPQKKPAIDRVRLVWRLVFAPGFAGPVNISPQKRTVGSDGCSARGLDAAKKAAEHFFGFIIVHARPLFSVPPLAAVHRSVGIKKGALAVSLAVNPAAKILAPVWPACLQVWIGWTH